MSSAVSREPAADSAQALEHFSRLLQFETDCWDVHHAMTNNKQDFILLDVRSELSFEQGHVDGAVSLPHQKITQQVLSLISL